LFVQEDVADRMIAGCARELKLGDPRDPATHVGPVIDAEAKQKLDAHVARKTAQARVHLKGLAPEGQYVAPHIFELSIGAVVGVQPFGGHGLSGTGPKAGGPLYLPRFATEQTVTVNTAAAGGNAALMSEVE
jgi:delta 1-pyrroline-5-carboxylate dehydrogenase